MTFTICLSISISGFLTSADGLSLTKAFMQIKEAKLCRSIVPLIKQIAGTHD
jgi:hypothetical protein